MPKTVEYYRSLGFEEKAAVYFAAGRKKIISVVANDNFTLIVNFDNGEKRLYDVRPLLKKGTVFEKIADLKTFRRAYVDEQHCIAWDIDPDVNSDENWNNKIDLCSDSCYMDSVPVADEILKFKNLLDCGAITSEEFEAKKKQLLGL